MRGSSGKHNTRPGPAVGVGGCPRAGGDPRAGRSVSADLGTGLGDLGCLDRQTVGEGRRSVRRGLGPAHGCLTTVRKPASRALSRPMRTRQEPADGPGVDKTFYRRGGRGPRGSRGTPSCPTVAPLPAHARRRPGITKPLALTRSCPGSFVLGLWKLSPSCFPHLRDSPVSQGSCRTAERGSEGPLPRVRPSPCRAPLRVLRGDLRPPSNPSSPSRSPSLTLRPRGPFRGGFRDTTRPPTEPTFRVSMLPAAAQEGPLPGPGGCPDAV